MSLKLRPGDLTLLRGFALTFAPSGCPPEGAALLITDRRRPPALLQVARRWAPRCGCALALSWAAAAAIANHYSSEADRFSRRLETTAAASLAAAPPPAIYTDPRPVLELLAVDPVVRVMRAEQQAIALHGGAGVPVTVPKELAFLHPVLAEKAVRTLTVLQLEPISPPGVREFDFTSLARRGPRGWFHSQVAGQPTPSVSKAILDAAKTTGVSPSYLHWAAWRESSFDPYARATTSSATGLFQFVERTWLTMVRDYGPRYGLDREAAVVRRDAGGRPYIADPVARARVLGLRYDPQVSALLAAELARQNTQTLRRFLGRTPTAGELYVAHVLGAEGAVQLMRAARLTPLRPAAQVLPKAAAANRSLFYAKGLPRSASMLMGVLSNAPREMPGPPLPSQVRGEKPSPRSSDP